RLVRHRRKPHLCPLGYAGRGLAMSAQHEDSPPTGPLPLDRRRAWQVVTLLLLAISLHVVPQLLRNAIDPALSILALMFIDAVAFAALMRSGNTLRAAGAVAIMFVVVYVSHQQNLVALPSIALNALIAGAFALTLRRGRVPMIHAIAAWAMAPEPVSPEFAHYLRRQTQAWMLLFVLMSLTCLLLALFAPFSWWSLFANVLSWPIILGFFFAESVVRRIWYRTLPNHTPLQTIGSALAYPGEAMRRAFERR